MLGLVRGYGRGRMSERRRCSHFFLFPFFFFLLVFLRPPGITGLIDGFFVGDGFGAEASVVVRKQFEYGSISYRPRPPCYVCA